MSGDVTRFVVTGCARSGTGYISQLLTELGARTEHERVFDPFTTRFERWGRSPGESSWLAVPFLDELPDDVVVLHQVRHPADVIRSLLGIEFFATDGTSVGRDARSFRQVASARGLAGIARRVVTPSDWGRTRRRRSDFVDFALRHCDGLSELADERDRCQRYWSEWNRMVESRAAERPGYLRYRLEDLDAALVATIAAAVGLDVDAAAVAAAMAAVPADFNTRPRGAVDAGSTFTPDVVEVAAAYGYTLGGTAD